MANSKRSACRVLTVFILLLSGSSFARSEVLIFDDEGVFNFRNPGLPVQDFESGNVAIGDGKGCPGPLNENTSNDCFSPGDILPGIEFVSSPQFMGDVGVSLYGPNFGGGTGNPFNAITNNWNNQTLDILFPNNIVTAVGMDLGCTYGGGPCITELTIKLFGEGDNLITQLNADATSDFDSFLGVESTEPITRINLSQGPGGTQFEGIDRISFGTPTEPVANIPTLSEWGMILMIGFLGIASIVFARRNRRAGNES